MNEDFQARLARLEAKRGTDHTPPPAINPPNEPTGLSGPRAPRSPERPQGRGPALKYILLGAFVLIGLPALAGFGTVFYVQNKEALEKVATGLDLLNTAQDGAAADPAPRDVPGTGDGVVLRLTPGTVTEAEGAYRASGAGQNDPLESSKKSMNYDKFEAKALETFSSE